MLVVFFRREYAFLSNFYSAKVIYNGLVYQNAEAAFQAQKENDNILRKKYENMSGAEAKRAGRRACLRPDWEVVKDRLMYEIVLAKFEQNPLLVRKLVNIKEPIIEENTWGDRYWGVVNGVGYNKLGKILMQVREYFIKSM